MSPFAFLAVGAKHSPQNMRVIRQWLEEHPEVDRAEEAERYYRLGMLTPDDAKALTVGKERP